MKRLSAAILAACALGAQAADLPTVSGAWARATVAGQQVAGAFLEITSPVAARLVGGSTPAAARVEVHSMSMEGEVMRMQKLDALELPPGQKVRLAPGGYHLMLMELKEPLKAGGKLPLTLEFDTAGKRSSVAVEVEVRAIGR